MAVVATVVALAAGTSCSDSDAPLASDPDATPATTSTSPGDNAAAETDGDSDAGTGTKPAPKQPKQQHERVPVDDFVAMMERGYDDVSSARVWMQVGGPQPMVTKGEMRFGEALAAMDMTIESPQVGGKARLILVDDVVYFGLPQLPRGQFVAADPTDPNDQLGQVAAGLMDDVSIESSFEGFDDALKKVTYLGPDVIDGQRLDHYEIKVDAKKALKDQGQPMPAGTPRALDYELWFDGQDRATRMTFDMMGTTLITMKLSEWNEPVDISAPPQSKVVELPR